MQSIRTKTSNQASLVEDRLTVCDRSAGTGIPHVSLSVAHQDYLTLSPVLTQTMEDVQLQEKNWHRESERRSDDISADKLKCRYKLKASQCIQITEHIMSL